MGISATTPKSTGPFRYVACATFLFGTVGRLDGQFSAFEKVLSKIESVNFYAFGGGFAPSSKILTAADSGDAPSQVGLTGVGFEVSLGVGESKGPVADSASCKQLQARQPMDTIEIVTDYGSGGAQTSPVATHVRTKPRARDACRRKVRVSYELALGYSQLRGFRAQDSSQFQLYGSLRELPSVALYATLNPEAHTNLYFGVRAGLVELHSFRGYGRTDTAYSGNATTFQTGAAIGVVVDFANLEFFVEPSYTFRRFPSIEWTPVNNVVPAQLPRQLSMNTWQVAFGIQMNIVNHDDEKK